MPGDIPQKIQILRYIGEQGIVSVDDIACHLSFPDKAQSIRRTLYKMGVSQVKYPGIKHGVWFIDKLGLFDLLNIYYPDFPQFEIKSIPVPQFLHYLEINRIRAAIEKSPEIIVDEWWSENLICAYNSSSFLDLSNSNIPDAVFWRKRQDGSRQQFFLEYERTLKNRDRYEDIFCTYAKQEGVQDRNVIYICQTPYIRKTLLNIETRLAQTSKLAGAGLYFQFVTLEGFYNSYGYEHVKKEDPQCVLSSSG